MPNINDASKAFVLKLQSLYYIEKQLEKALPKLAKAATDPELKAGFLSHLVETKNHSKRLEQIFKMIDAPVRKTVTEGIRGIIEDGSWVIKEVDADPETRDVMLAAGARYAEHYEMAGYLSAIEEAGALGLDEPMELLIETLEEEQLADEALSQAMKRGLGTLI